MHFCYIHSLPHSSYGTCQQCDYDAATKAAATRGSANELARRAEKWRWYEVAAVRRAHTHRADYLMACAEELRKVAAVRGLLWERELKEALRYEHAAREHYQRAQDIRADERNSQID